MNFNIILQQFGKSDSLARVHYVYLNGRGYHYNSDAQKIIHFDRERYVKVLNILWLGAFMGLVSTVSCGTSYFQGKCTV